MATHVLELLIISFTFLRSLLPISFLVRLSTSFTLDKFWRMLIALWIRATGRSRLVSGMLLLLLWCWSTWCGRSRWRIRCMSVGPSDAVLALSPTPLSRLRWGTKASISTYSIHRPNARRLVCPSLLHSTLAEQFDLGNDETTLILGEVCFLEIM
jgi:hypothetical protein